MSASACRPRRTRSESRSRPYGRRLGPLFRLGLTLAIVGTIIGLGGMAYAAFWIYTHLS
jgi:hypothetical protein